MPSDSAVVSSLLLSDYARFAAAYAEQKRRDPDHVLALAMVAADMERAYYKWFEYEAGLNHGKAEGSRAGAPGAVDNRSRGFSG